MTKSEAKHVQSRKLVVKVVKLSIYKDEDNDYRITG